MIQLQHTAVMNMEGAFRGMRNPLNSWEKSDSRIENGVFIPGETDLDLARRLCEAGSDHRKFVRQILVCVDITAPIYWWKEFDTYKVATVANSTSTMHTIHKTPITAALFSTDGMRAESLAAFEAHLTWLEALRLEYLETKDKTVWRELIQLLPSSFHQMRTVTLNYETLMNIYFARQSHKLSEWHTLCDWILQLPYFSAITGVGA